MKWDVEPTQMVMSRDLARWHGNQIGTGSTPSVGICGIWADSHGVALLTVRSTVWSLAVGLATDCGLCDRAREPYTGGLARPISTGEGPSVRASSQRRLRSFFRSRRDVCGKTSDPGLARTPSERWRPYP